ncbi:extracellular solute-binding protein [Endozoicomonas sp. SESOKO1]|uniref:extracellular solute-binding protein n=1 Tax=Endozoicomonas sp. SESOKO1 TaxID=2828742 RepID=UPI00214781F7|nr:extracellular solute-binding protein [Endozoicomonas sp. SESOKO1]
MTDYFKNGFLFISLIYSVFAFPDPADTNSTKAHGLSFHNSLLNPENFTHFGYANPRAPKGGTLRKGISGSFDSFNTFAPKGVWADGSYFLYDPLMVKAGDEPYSVYGLIARQIEYPDDFQWVIYHLNPHARFHDGHAITSEDVLFTFQSLKKQGPPHYRHFYGIIDNVEAISPHSVRFSFSEPPAKSLILRLSQLRVLPAHYWRQPEHDLFKATLKPPLSSGPYRVKDFSPGRFVTYERVRDYWAAELAVNKGRHNFDLIRTDYYRDDGIALEAFKKGEYDLRIDANPRSWSQAYKPEKAGKATFIQEKIDNKSLGIQSFVFNLRKPMFASRKVRKAISQALDFNWTNQHLFFGMYHQAYSLFSNSDLAADKPPSEKEKALLAPWQDELPDELFTTRWEPVQTDGSGNWRKNKRLAFQWLKEAGYSYKNKTLVDQHGQPLTFEILLTDPEHERFVIPFVRNLSELGISVSINTVDISRYINRIRKFDFDMIIHGFYPDITPGTELKNFWSSASADSDAGQNLSGIKLKSLDRMIDNAIMATTREELALYTRAIDRIVLWHYAVIPQWYLPYWPMVYRPGLQHPELAPPYDNGLSTWWREY